MDKGVRDRVLELAKVSTPNTWPLALSKSEITLKMDLQFAEFPHHPFRLANLHIKCTLSLQLRMDHTPASTYFVIENLGLCHCRAWPLYDGHGVREMT